MRLLYFAWVRQKVGISEEEISLPPAVRTVTDLAEYLRHRGEGFANVFSDVGSLRAAVNQEHAAWETPVCSDDEIAFFPPVTGG